MGKMLQCSAQDGSFSISYCHSNASSSKASAGLLKVIQTFKVVMMNGGQFAIFISAQHVRMPAFARNLLKDSTLQDQECTKTTGRCQDQ